VEGTSATIQSNNTLALYSPSGVNSQGIQMESALATASNAPYQKVPAVRSSVADDLIQPAPTFFTDQIGIEPAQQLLA
jgi:hypothetical protein